MIHGSLEDFTEVEQRTADCNGDHVSATRKGVHLPDRPNQLIDDHRQANERLQRISRAWKPELPKHLNPEHQAVRKTLAESSGEQLDAKYLASQIMDHQKTSTCCSGTRAMARTSSGWPGRPRPCPWSYHLEMARDLQSRLVLMDQRPRNRP